MKIPKRFKLMNSIINIEVDNKLLDERDSYGLSDFRYEKIYLANAEKHNLSQAQIDRTFFHELMHHIFIQLNEKDLSENEKLIDNVAGLLSQAFETMEY